MGAGAGALAVPLDEDEELDRRAVVLERLVVVDVRDAVRGAVAAGARVAYPPSTAEMLYVRAVD